MTTCDPYLGVSDPTNLMVGGLGCPEICFGHPGASMAFVGSCFGLLWCRWRWLEAALEAFLTVILTKVLRSQTSSWRLPRPTRHDGDVFGALWPGSVGPSRLSDRLVAPYCILNISDISYIDFTNFKFVDDRLSRKGDDEVAGVAHRRCGMHAVCSWLGV